MTTITVTTGRSIIQLMLIMIKQDLSELYVHLHKQARERLIFVLTGIESGPTGVWLFVQILAGQTCTAHVFSLIPMETEM